ncbi:hypothetical protein GQ600_5063 [Phytophthora cactorum]|nr:hypothetical protein GQ600_5063 [Phytophthora cactorum]
MQDSSFDEFFQHWWENEAPSGARVFAEDNADYYAYRDLSKTQEDPDVARYGRYQDTPGANADLDADFDDDMFEVTTTIFVMILGIRVAMMKTLLQFRLQAHRLTTMPSLERVSAFSLNQKQHKRFARMDKKLLTSILVPHQSDTQEIAFHGGLPGAGKSRVIGALQEIALRWESPESVATAAYQVVAAQTTNGQTIHKRFG